MPVVVALQQASAHEVGQFLSGLVNKPLEIEPEARQAAECVQVDIYQPEPIPARKAFEISDATLRPLGVSVTESDRAVVLRRLAEVPLPPRCKTPPPATSLPRPPRPPLDPLVPQVIGGIRRVSPTEVEISAAARALFDGDMERAARPARLVDDKGSSGVAGVRLFGVRGDGLAGALGFENGDLLLAVDKTPFTSSGQAKPLYDTLKGERVVKVKVRRNGQEIELTFRFLPG